MTNHSHRDVDQILNLGIKSIEDLKQRFRRNPDILNLLDEQTDLLMENASQYKTQQNLAELVRKGLMSELAASVLCDAVAKASHSTAEKISLNSLVIRHVLSVQNRKPVIEA